MGIKYPSKNIEKQHRHVAFLHRKNLNFQNLGHINTKGTRL